MAAKSNEEQGMDLPSIIQNARKRAMNIALVIGKDGLSIAADPRKGPEIMWREAKKIGGGSKGGMGVCNIVGKEIQIQFLNDDYPASLMKSLKQTLRDAGLKFKPIFIAPDGTREGDEDEEGDVDGVEGASANSAGAEEPDDGMTDPAAKLRADFDSLAEDMKRVQSGSDEGAAKKITGLASMFTATAEKNPQKAAAILKMLQEALAALAVTPIAAPPDGAGGSSRRRKNLSALGRNLDGLLADLA